MLKKTRVLIVEDEAIIAEDIKSILEKKNYDVLDVAMSADEALFKIQNLNPDIVLMDICLNDEVDGISIAAQIRTMSKLPIVFITAYADKGIIQRAKSVEPDGYILKPYSEDSIYANIEIALHKNKASREKFNHLLTALYE